MGDLAQGQHPRAQRPQAGQQRRVGLFRRRRPVAEPLTSRLLDLDQIAHLGKETVQRVGQPHLQQGRAEEPALEGRRFVQGDDPPPADDGDAVGQHLRFGQVVGAEEDGAPVAAHIQDGVADLLGALGVHGRRRLVQQQEGRVVEHGPDEGQFLAHPFGVFGQPLAGGLGQPKAGQQFIGTAADLRLRKALEPTEKGQIFVAAHPQVKAGEFGEQADGVAHLAGLAHRIETGHPRPALAGFEDGGQHPHRGRLARAVGTQQGQDFAGSHPQAHAVHRREPGQRLAARRSPFQWTATLSLARRGRAREALGQAFGFDHPLRHHFAFHLVEPGPLYQTPGEISTFGSGLNIRETATTAAGFDEIGLLA